MASGLQYNHTNEPPGVKIEMIQMHEMKRIIKLNANNLNKLILLSTCNRCPYFIHWQWVEKSD